MRHKLYERLGSFRVKKKDIDELPDWLQQMMARVIILKAEFSFEEDGVRYIAVSPEFSRHDPEGFTRVYDPVIEDGRFLRFAP